MGKTLNLKVVHRVIQEKGEKSRSYTTDVRVYDLDTGEPIDNVMAVEFSASIDDIFPTAKVILLADNFEIEAPFEAEESLPVVCPQTKHHDGKLGVVKHVDGRVFQCSCGCVFTYDIENGPVVLRDGYSEPSMKKMVGYSEVR